MVRGTFGPSLAKNMGEKGASGEAARVNRASLRSARTFPETLTA